MVFCKGRNGVQSTLLEWCIMIQWSLQAKFCLEICCDDRDTVDGRNPAPPLMYETSWKMGYSQCQLVSRISSINGNFMPDCGFTPLLRSWMRFFAVPQWCQEEAGSDSSGWIVGTSGHPVTPKGCSKKTTYSPRNLRQDPLNRPLNLSIS